MDKIINSLFINNWQRKIVAVITAVIVWLFVNSSINETKTLINVPVRVINLPPDKTISGLMPNRLLSKRVTLTLTGTKDVINELEPSDLEVLLDVSTANSDPWFVQIGKKNLVSLNPDIDLSHHISQVAHNELVLKISPMITGKIPINLMQPIGEVPSGYEYLDIWPQRLYQTVSGPEEDIQSLMLNGIDITFNLSDISKTDLDSIKGPQSTHDDEISVPVPEKWLKVPIPFHNNALEDFNDPEAKYLHINLLRKQYLQIDKAIPIRVFYPLKYINTINPKTSQLALNEQMQEKNGIVLISIPLYLRDVSRLFLNLISDNMEITILAAPLSERSILQWTLEVVDAHEIEDVYVALFRTNHNNSKGFPTAFSKKREWLLRKRFREYMHRLAVYKAPDQRLRLESKIIGDRIVVNPVQ